MPEYTGELTNENICKIFDNAADFYSQQLFCDHHVIYLYAID